MRRGRLDGLVHYHPKMNDRVGKKKEKKKDESRPGRVKMPKSVIWAFLVFMGATIILIMISSMSKTFASIFAGVILFGIFGWLFYMHKKTQKSK